MKKKKKIRQLVIEPAYHFDANYLIRLSYSIQLDETKTLEWRRKTINLIQELVVLFQDK